MRVAALIIAGLATLAATGPARAEALRFDPAAAIAQDDPAPESPGDLEPIEDAWRVRTGAIMTLGGDQSDLGLGAFVSFDTFLADRFELSIEFDALWVGSQQQSDVGVFAVIPTFRYHFWESTEGVARRGGGTGISLYLDFGVGVMIATRDVSPDGSEFNLTPRAGVGMAFELGDGASAIIGARWQHFSNARILGGDRNDSWDALMLYTGISIPF